VHTRILNDCTYPHLADREAVRCRAKPPALHAARIRTHLCVCVCVCVLARVTRAAGGSSLRVGRGARPLSVEVECAARRPRYIRAGLLGLTGWRASLTAARRSRRARAPTHLMQATAVTCHTHRGERPRLEHAQRHIQANAQKRRRAGQPPARRRTNGGWSCRGETGYQCRASDRRQRAP